MNAGQEDKSTPLEKHNCYRNVDQEGCSLFYFAAESLLLLKAKIYLDLIPFEESGESLAFKIFPIYRIIQH